MSKANAAGPHRTTPAGPIRVDGLYPIADAMSRLGWL